MNSEKSITRLELASRWGVSVRTVDRIRQSGELQWIDLRNGAGARPLVRFRIPDVEAYEAQVGQGGIMLHSQHKEG
jgi:hypothetical protein